MIVLKWEAASVSSHHWCCSQPVYLALFKHVLDMCFLLQIALLLDSCCCCPNWPFSLIELHELHQTQIGFNVVPCQGQLLLWNLHNFAWSRTKRITFGANAAAKLMVELFWLSWRSCQSLHWSVPAIFIQYWTLLSSSILAERTFLLVLTAFSQ